MKTFYKLTSFGFEQCAKLDKAFDLLSELEVDTETLELPSELEDAYSLFEECNDMEFSDRDAEKVIGSYEALLGLDKAGYIEVTYEDNN